jgi:hypothetical protein
MPWRRRQEGKDLAEAVDISKLEGPYLGLAAAP